MFKIRQEQMDAFSEEADQVFVEEIVDHLHENHAEAIGRLPDDILEEMVENGIARARRYGLTWESSITAFVATMFEVAPNFDEHPPIRAVLTDERIPPNERFDQAVERVSEADWDAAEAAYDENAWFPELRDER